MKPWSRFLVQRWFTHQIAPLLLGAMGVVLAFWLQESPRFRRHALLIAILVGIAFFHPALRESLLILLCYGFAFYILVRVRLDWLGWDQLTLAEQVQTIFWIPIGLFSLIGAVTLGQDSLNPRGTGFVFLALATYFVSYAYAEAFNQHWLQAVAGGGFALIGYLAALNSFIKGRKKG